MRTWRHMRGLLIVLLVAVTVVAGVLASQGAVSEAAVLPGPQAAHGSDHTLLIKPGGSLWSWGANSAGQLGSGVTGNNYYVAVRVGAANDWAAVACGDAFSLAIKNDGSLWAWGLNTYGQLGLGDTAGRTTPQRVGSAGDWVGVAGGDSHTLALKSDGSLWAWGRNTYGQLGLSDTANRTTPTRVGSATDWDAFSCGADFSAALKADHTLWVWGRNSRSQLGLGDTAVRLAPTQLGVSADWASVGCGDEDVRALKTGGTLWAWGYNSFGQLGLGDQVIRSAPTKVGSDADWAALACGDDHTVALKSGGSLWTWGDNNYGQLGQGTADNVAHPSPTRVGTATEWSRILCGDDFTSALRPGDQLWAWGDNTTGDLSLGDLTSRPSPTLLFIVTDTASPPIASLTSTTHPDAAVWYSNADPTFSWSASDASGIAGYKSICDRTAGTAAATGYPSGATTRSYAALADGIWYFHVRAVDRAGNWGPTSTRMVRIDTTAPVSTQTGADDAWHLVPVMVTFRATDPSSGVAATEYHVDAGSWVTGNAVTVSATGAHTVTYRSRDNAGNVEADKTCQVNIQGTGSSYVITATSGANGSVTPPGVQTVANGGSQTYTITPNPGDHVLDVLVDGGSVGAVTSYTFTDVTANHTIAATFAPNALTSITVTAPNGGESWTPGSQHNLTWSLNAPAQTGDFQLWVVDSANNYYYVGSRAVDPTLTNYSLSWAVGLPVANDYKLAVYYRPDVTAWNFTLSDTSDTAFAIGASATVLTVTAPNGGESWAQGSPQNLTWSVSTPVLTGEFQLWVVDSANNYYYVGAKAVDPTLMNYTLGWTASLPVANDYKLAVYYRPDVIFWSFTLNDASNATFAVTP